MLDPRTLLLPTVAMSLMASLGVVSCQAGEAGQPPGTEAAAATQPVTMEIASLTGPTTIGLAGILASVADATAGEDYSVQVYGTPDEVVPLLVQGKVDAALIPANLAAVVYSKTAGTDAAIQVAAVNTLGVLQVVESGDSVHSIADLAGHAVYSTGKGASPEYVLNYLLAANGLTAGDDVTVEYLAEATEVAAAVTATPGAIGVLPQPYVTVLESVDPTVRTALDLTDEWAAVTPGSQLVTGVLVVRAAFAAQHPDAVATFLAEYQASTAWVNDSPTEAAPYIVAAGIVPSEDLAVAAIPACHVTYVAGAELPPLLGGYLQVLFDADPASVGGAMPGNDFYLAG